MPQISTPQAHAVTGGSSSVVAGDLDTGLVFSIRTSRRITTQPTAPTARVARRRRWRPGTTRRGTGRTPPGRRARRSPAAARAILDASTKGPSSRPFALQGKIRAVPILLWHGYLLAGTGSKV
jgi:hypothetical protein